MSTMKDIARKVNISLSTVSIVLSGQGNQRNISTKTQAAIWRAAADLNYKPNLAARRLRKGNNDTIVILVLWAEDFRASLIVRFLRGLQDEITASNQKVELIIHLYKSGKIHDSREFLDPSICTAAIICNTTEEEIAYLEDESLDIPIVLYDRSSKKYSTVFCDNSMLGKMPAEVFLKRNYDHYLILRSEYLFKGVQTRVESFITTLTEGGVDPASISNLSTNNLVSETYRIAGEYVASHTGTMAIFCTDDALAVGAIRAVHKSGLQFQKDVELISIGNWDKLLQEYLYPSLTVSLPPMEDMARSCIVAILDILENPDYVVKSIKHEARLIFRESCTKK